MSETLALPQGSLVLVTGANGFVGSHVVEQFLAHGYRVRGTTRTVSKLDSLKKRWDEKYPGKFEVAQVSDILAEGAFHDATKGCDGVAHTASNVSFSSDVDEVVRDAVEGTLNALRSAAATPSIKRFVLTSSIVAVGLGGDKKYGPNDFFNDSIGLAKALPADDPRKGSLAYASSKTQAEQAAWKFVEDNKPSFVLNVVNPAFVLGEILNLSGEAGSSAGFTKALFTGTSDMVRHVMTDVEFVPATDIGLLHVGALVLPGVANKRLIASPHASSWNQVLAIFRKNFPQQKFYEDLPETKAPSNESTYDSDASLEVLKKMGKEEGWTPLEQTLLELVA
ncbi:hypothetical protein JCM5350_007564 [Sporobolomyces pararoseus]